MIKIEQVNFKYSSQYENNGISNLNLNIKEGEFVVLCGKSGCGKTTVTRLINGLIPHFFEGELSGEIFVNGQDMKEIELSDMASVSSSVFQNPKSQFFNLDTTGEIAFGAENLNLDKKIINERIEKSKNDFCLENLMDRNIFELSGGEKQQIACGSAYASDPLIYVFDEPSSNMDAKAIKRFKQILAKLKALGKTIIISEHRLYYLTELADRYIYFERGQINNTYSKEEFLALSQEELFSLGLRHTNLENVVIKKAKADENKREVLSLENLSFIRGKKKVLDIDKVSFKENSVIALIGENGSGKTTFSEVVSGLVKSKGEVYLEGDKLDRKTRTLKSYIVMQDVNRQLFCPTVKEELQLGVKNSSANFDALMEKMLIKEFEERHPGSLSGGQKQRVAICSAISAEKAVIFFDEPTSGLDYEGMDNFCKLIDENKENQLVSIIITHDLELVAGCCTHVLHLQDGKVFDFYPIDDEGLVKLKKYFILDLQH